jgi:class 3 adenylate cyclase/tetratricopeptide (TPR) repeat protein
VVRCPGCGTPGAPDQKFCGACGAPLIHPAATAPDDYTPKHLAEQTLASRAALEGERKLVTVLFVDVSGFTALADRLDPEDVHRLMNRAFECMLAEVHRYEGTVNQFLGDGIMALFGAPIAHEHHARLALHAALGIRRALEAYQRELAPRGIRFQARQGLNTGLVVVGSIGSGRRRDYTAVGDTTNVAARLQQVANPGQVIVSEATHRLVSGHFETRSLGEIRLKGKPHAVHAWEVLAAHEPRTRLEIEADRGLAPFVGRERELAVLLDRFEEAAAGRGQVAWVVGDAGIGKSRLLLELRRRLGDRAAWQEGHCLSFGRAMAFHPLVDLVRRQFGVGEGDGPPTIAARIERGLTELGADLAPLAGYVRALLSIDPGDAAVRGMSPVERRGEMFGALRRLLVRAAERRPQALVIEDLHWIDSASEQFLATLVDSAPALRVLLVFTARPEYASPLGERSYVTRLVLRALSGPESARVAAAILAADAVPDALQSLVAAKAEGNPFYVEELVRSLEESGTVRRTDRGLELARPVTDIAVPATIQDVIAARIDRLPEGPKRALQLASVIGREFSHRLMDRLAEEPARSPELLRQLTALELIRERRLLPELTYAFRHALTQDVAYASLLRERRKELHGQIGRAIEELYADRLPEHYEVLAHHFSRAEDWTRARDYLLRAAEKATHAFSLREAITLYDEALQAAGCASEPVPDTALTAIHRARADLLLGIGEFGRSRDAAETLLDLSRRAGDQATEVDALVQLASALQWAEDFPAALGRAHEAIERAAAIGAQAPLAGGLFVRGYVRAVTGELDGAEEDAARALSIGRAVGDASRQALAIHILALRRSWQGQYGDSLRLSGEGVGIARQHRLVIPLLRCLWNQGAAWSDLGQYDAALAALAEGLSLAEKIGDEAFAPRFLNTIGWLRIECGDFRRGIELSEQAYAATTRSARAGHGTGAERRAFIRNNEADAWMAQGDLAGAADALSESEHVVRHPPPSRWMTWRYAMHCHASLGQLALLQGAPERARRSADECLAVAVPTRSRKFKSWAWRIKGESATLRRAWDEADAALPRALGIAEAIGQPRQIWLAHLALGRLHAALGRRDAAARDYRAARAVVRELRARAGDPGVRAGLESSPLVRELEQLAARE